VVIIGISFVLNYVSINFSARVFKYLIAFTLAVFSFLVAFSLPELDSSRLNENPLVEYKKVDWPLFINLLIFNSAGFDAGGSIISYVQQPRQTVPLAMLLVGFGSTALYITTLLLPYMAVNDARADWQAGHLSVVALQLGGKGLQVLVILACAIVNLQVYSVSLQTAAYTTAAMADQNVFPKRVGVGKRMLTLTKQTSRGTPSHALVFCGLLSAGFALAPFVVNLAIESVLYSAVMFAQIGCVLNLEEKNRLFVPQNRRWRLCLVVIPMLLATWIVIVQHQTLLLAMIAVTSFIGFASVGLDFDTTSTQPIVSWPSFIGL
jgi:amino acid transporter